MKTIQAKTTTVQTKSSGPFFKKESRTDISRQAGSDAFFARKVVGPATSVQRKLNIGSPNDHYEREADSVADSVVQRLTLPGRSITNKGSDHVQSKPFFAKTISTPSFQAKCDTCVPEETKEKKEDERPQSDKKIRKKPIFESNAEPPDDEKNIQRKCAECEKEEKEKKDGGKEIHRKAIFESNEASSDDVPVQRKCAGCEKEEKLQKKEATGSPEHDHSAIESGLSASKGAGTPLPEDTRQQMESSIGADFSDVRIHADSHAAQMSKDLNAQAFTHGNDIYFNAGKYDTTTNEGKHLLAHELTHTVQQSGGANMPVQQLIQKSGSNSTNAKTSITKATKEELDAAKDDSGSIDKKKGQLIFHIAELKTKKYEIPQTVIDKVAGNKKFQIPKGGERQTAQDSIWKSDVRAKAKEKLKKVAGETEKAAIKDGDIMRLKQLKAKKAFKGIVGTFTQLANEVLVPSWDFKGESSIYQIEHMLDWQIIGPACDNISNLILLEANKNREVGDKVKKAIPEALTKIAKNYKKEFDDVPQDGKQIKEKYDVIIDKISGEGTSLKEKENYKPDDIKNTDDKKNPYQEQNISLKEEGIPDGYFLLTTSGRRASYLIPYKAKNHKIGAFLVTVEEKNGKVESITLESLINGKETDIGVEKSLKKKKVSVDGEQKDKYIIQDGAEIGAISPVLKSLSLTKFSPIVIDDKDIIIEGFDVSVKGKIASTLSILKGVDILFFYENGDFNVQAIIPLDQIAKNIPKPFKVDYCNIEIGGGTNTPIYIAGGLGFSIEKFGQGEIFAKLDRNGVAFDGKFNFEARWFDPAEICVSYEKGEWKITGRIGLKKGLLKGVKSATFCIGYMHGTFMASGDAELDIPGLDRVKLGAAISESGEMSFFAEVQLKKIPGIKSGMVRVNILSKADGELKVSIAGEAEPDFPGIPELAPKLTVSYEDGIFDVRATAAYKKGRFQGSVEVGVTNKQVDEKGQPTGAADEKNNLSVFGFGTLTVELFKNIKGTVSLRVTPEKEVLVAGEILVQNLSPFGDGYNFDKELLKFPSVSIPLVGIPGMSVSAFIEGGVHFKFNWQPLMLKELKVDFKETNINELDKINLEISGSVGSSAHAEVYLEIKAGIKAEVLIASLKGALGGQAGLGLDAEAGGKLDATWNMDKGLQFKEIRAYLDVTPKAIFRLTGSVSVDLDLWITTINLYYHEWVLAEKQLDLGGITLKLDFPIKFTDEGNVEAPDPDKMNLQKPDFSGDAGQKILNDAINGDAEKELAEKKRQIKEKIHYDLRSHTWDDEFTPSKYREKMMDKYEKSPELQQFVSKTIDDELKAIEYEEFEKEKNLIRNANVPLQNKLMMTNMFAMFYRYVSPAEVEAFKADLVLQEELRKLKEAQAAAAAQQPPPPVDNNLPKKLPDPSKAPAPIKHAKSGHSKTPAGSKDQSQQPGAPHAAKVNDRTSGDEKKIQKKVLDPSVENAKKEDQENAVGAHQENEKKAVQRVAISAVKGHVAGTIQKAPSTELDDSFKKALDDKDWKKAAEYLNGFSKEDISERLKGKSTGIVAAIHAGALENPAVGPKAQVAELTRWAYLEMNFKNEIKKSQWKEAAMYLNGFNDADIKKYLAGVDLNARINLRLAAIPNGYPAVVKNVDADIEFQVFEKNRVAKLEDDYNTAVAKKEWKNAATLLNAYNDEDIQLKLALLNITSPESVKLIRSAADNMEQNSRVGRFAQSVIMGSTDAKKLLLAGPLVGDIWSQQFIKGMEISGIAARFGESWQRIKDNFSDPANGAKFISGIYVGYPLGVAKDIWDNIKGIIELAWDLVKLQVEATFEPDKLAGEITRIVKALPQLLLKLLNGEEIGYQVGLYLSRNMNSEFIQKSAFDEGLFVGEIVGRFTTEIALLFVGVEEVSAVAKALRATKWGVAVADALEGSRIAKALLEARGAGKVLKGTEELVLDAEKMENALIKMARIEEKAPAVTEDMMKLEQRVMADRVSKSVDLAKPLKEAGFDAEITVGEHHYKRSEVDGKWCRFTTKSPTCNIQLPEDVEQAVDKKVPPSVRLAYMGTKKLGRISADTFEKARAFRKGLGTTEEAMKKNVAILKVMTEDDKVIFLEAANQGSGGAHSEEMLAGQLEDLNNQLRKAGNKAHPVELFSERVPCGNCREVIKLYFGEIDTFYMAGSTEPERWKLIRDRWESIEKALAATKK